VQAAGAILLYYGIGSALGPLFAGMSMAVVGPSGLFLFMAAILALYLLLVVARLRLAPHLRVRRATAYRAYPRTSPAAFELMRRVRPRRPSRSKDKPSEN
jgi:MFS family permease